MARQIAESAMREAVGRRPAQDIFRDDRQGIAQSVRDIMQATFDQYGTGLAVNAISIEDAAPPREVADAFDEVQRAEQDEDVSSRNRTSTRTRSWVRRVVKPRRSAKRRPPTRRGSSRKPRVRLSASSRSTTNMPRHPRSRASVSSSRPWKGVLGNSNKVIVEQGNGQGVVPYLPLPQLEQNRQQQQQQQQQDRTDVEPSHAHRRGGRTGPADRLFVRLRRQRAPAGHRAALRRDRRRQDRAGHLLQGPLRLPRRRQRPAHRGSCPALRPRRHPRPGLRRQVLRGGRVRRVSHPGSAPLPRDRVGQPDACRTAACVRVSTQRFAGSTVCAASRPLFRKSGRR